MNDAIRRKLELITVNHVEFLNILRTKYPLFHLSNLFLRDIQYGVRFYLENKGLRAGYQEAEEIARNVVEFLEKQNILKKIDRQTWLLLYPEFRAEQAS
ncbi:MAG TPA: hypothetical protein VIH68_03315 [Bacteroidota bacterium]